MASHKTNYTDKFLSEEAKALIAWSRNLENIYLTRFALERGYSPKEMMIFSEKSEEFAKAMEMAKLWQESKLVEGGLNNRYNPSFAKYALTNLHGWVTDKQSESINQNHTYHVNYGGDQIKVLSEGLPKADLDGPK